MYANSNAESRRQVLAELQSKGRRPLARHAHVSSLDDGSQPRMIFSRRSNSKPKREITLSGSELSKVNIKTGSYGNLNKSSANNRTNGLNGMKDESNTSPRSRSHSPPSSPKSPGSSNVSRHSSTSRDKSDAGSALVRRTSSSTSNVPLPLIPAPKGFKDRKPSTASSSSKASSPSRSSKSSSHPPSPSSSTSTLRNDDDDTLAAPPPPLDLEDSHANDEAETVNHTELKAKTTATSMETVSESRSSNSFLGPKSATPSEVMNYFDQSLLGQAGSITSLDGRLDDYPRTPLSPVFAEYEEPTQKEEVAPQSFATPVIQNGTQSPKLPELPSPRSDNESQDDNIEHENGGVGKTDSSEEGELSPRIEEMRFTRKGRQRRRSQPNITKFRPDVKTVRQQIKPGTVDELATLFKSLHETDDLVMSPTRSDGEGVALSPNTPRSETSDELKDITLEGPPTESDPAPPLVQVDTVRSSHSSTSSKSSAKSTDSDSSSDEDGRAKEGSEMLSQKEEPKAPETFDYISASKDIIKRVMSRENSRSNSFNKERSNMKEGSYDLQNDGDKKEQTYNFSVESTADNPLNEERESERGFVPLAQTEKTKSRTSSTSSDSSVERSSSSDEKKNTEEGRKRFEEARSKLKDTLLFDLTHRAEVTSRTGNSFEKLPTVPSEPERDLGRPGPSVTAKDKEVNKTNHEFIYGSSSEDAIGEVVAKTVQTGLEAAIVERGDVLSSTEREEGASSARLAKNGEDIGSASGRPSSLVRDKLSLASWIRTQDVSGDSRHGDVTVIDGDRGGDSTTVREESVERKITVCRRRSSVTLSPVVDESYKTVVSELKSKKPREDSISSSEAGSSSSSSDEEEEGQKNVPNAQNNVEWNATGGESVASTGEHEDKLTGPSSNGGMQSDGVNVSAQPATHLQSQIERSSGTGLFAHVIRARVEGDMESIGGGGQSGGSFAETHREPGSFSGRSTQLDAPPPSSSAGGEISNATAANAPPNDDFMSILNDISLETDIASNFAGKSNRVSGGYSVHTYEEIENVDSSVNVKDNPKPNNNNGQKEYVSSEAFYDNPHHSVSEVSAGESDREHFHLGLKLKNALKPTKTHYTVTGSDEDRDNSDKENAAVTNVSLDEELKHLHKSLSPQASCYENVGNGRASVSSSVASTPKAERHQSPKETSFDKDFFSQRRESSQSVGKVSLKNALAVVANNNELPATVNNEDSVVLRRGSTSDHSSKRSSVRSTQELDESNWSKDKFKALRTSFELRGSQTDLYRPNSVDRNRFSGGVKTGSQRSSTSSLNRQFPTEVSKASVDLDITPTNGSSAHLIPSTSGLAKPKNSEGKHIVDTSFSDSDSDSGRERTKSKKRTKKYMYDLVLGEGKRRNSNSSASSKGSKGKGKSLKKRSKSSSSSDSDDSATKIKRTVSKQSNTSDKGVRILPVTSTIETNRDSNMSAVVGEVSSFSIHRKVTSVEETSSNNTPPPESHPTSAHNLSNSSGVYLIQDNKGEYYAVQEVDSAPLSNTVQQVVSNGQIDYGYNQDSRVQGSTDLVIDNTAVSEDKAREVISTFLDSEKPRNQLQYQSDNGYNQSASSRDDAFMTRVSDGQYTVSTRAVDHQPSSAAEGSAGWAGYNTVSSFSSSHQPQSLVLQQAPVNVPGNQQFSGNYVITGHGSSFDTSNDYLRDSTVSVQTQVNTRSDNSQTWETPGSEPYTTGRGAEDAHYKSMVVTNFNTPQQQVYIQESHSSPGSDTSFDQQRYVVRDSNTALQPISVNLNQAPSVQSDYVAPYQSRPISVTTTTHAVVGEKVDMHIEFPQKENQNVVATAELARSPSSSSSSSSSSEQIKQQYRVRTLPTKSVLKKTSKYDTSLNGSASDIVFTKNETVTADVSLGGRRREITLYPANDTSRGSKRSSRSSSDSSPDGSSWKVQRGGKLYPSRSLSRDSSPHGRKQYAQNVYSSYEIHDDSDNGSIWKVRSFSNSEPDGLNSLTDDTRGRRRNRSPDHDYDSKSYRVVSTKTKHHSPERIFRDAKLSLRQDDYDTSNSFDEESTGRKTYKTVTRVFLNGESPPQQRSRSPSPHNRYRVSSVQRQESYERRREDSVKDDGRVYEVVTVKSSKKGGDANDDGIDDFSGQRRRYRVIGDSQSSIDRYKVRAHSSPKQNRKVLQDATITRTERMVPSRVNSVPPTTKSHRTVVQLEVDGNKNIKEKREIVDSEPIDSQYKVSNVMSGRTVLKTNNASFDSSPNAKLWRTRRSKSADRSRRHHSSSDDSDSDLERSGSYDVSPKLVKTTKQKDGSKVYVVNSTVTDPHDEGAAVLYPPGWFQTTIDINDNHPDMKNKNYVVFDKNAGKHTQTFTTDTSDAQAHKSEKTVYFVREAEPPSHLSNKLSIRTQSSEFISPDSGQGTEIASSDGEGEASRQKYERVERIYEVRSEPELPEQFRESTEIDVSKDLRVLRGKILIKNRLDGSEQGDDEFGENVNVFDNSFHMGKDNPLYSSDQDLLASLQREEEEELSRQLNQDITFETVDRIAHKYKGQKPQDLSPKPARRQNLSALLLSKLANVDSKDIRQSIDVEHHNEEIFGDIDFIHADGERRGCKNTSNFDSVNEKVELTIQQGKAYVIIKVIAERIVPTDYEFNVWRKSQAIVTRQIEIDLLANDQRRRLYHHVMDTVGPAGAIAAGTSDGEYAALAPHEKQLSGMETLKLFSQILDVADGGAEVDHTDMRTKQEMGQLPAASGMDLLY